MINTTDDTHNDVAKGIQNYVTDSLRYLHNWKVNTCIFLEVDALCNNAQPHRNIVFNNAWELLFSVLYIIYF